MVSNYLFVPYRTPAQPSRAYSPGGEPLPLNVSPTNS